MKLEFIKLNPDAIVPTYGTEYAAGADLYALPEGDIRIEAGETVLIHTGIAISIPEGYAGFIFARSGIATKRGLAPANKVGVIDSDYRGEITVALHNHSGADAIIEPGQRIAQLLICPVMTAGFIQRDALDDTDRGSGGFGSTGSK